MEDNELRSAMEVSKPRPRFILPKFYYLDHFENVIQKLEKIYPAEFDEDVHDLIKRFQSFSQDEKCVTLRAFNRKKNFFVGSDFLYEEIERPSVAFENLQRKGWFRPLNNDDLIDVISNLTKSHLIELGKQTGLKLKTSARKSELESIILEHRPHFEENVLLNFGFSFCYKADLEYLLFLYFGDSKKKLTSFALRDLHLLKTSAYSLNSGPRFVDKSTARSAFFYAKLKDRIPPLLNYEKIEQFILGWPKPEDSRQEDRRNNMIFELSKHENLTSEQALSVLRQARGAPARIACVRLLLKLKKKDEARDLINEIMDQPSCGEELVLAENLMARHFAGKSLNVNTQVLRDAEVIAIDEAFRGHPEWGLQSTLREQGYTVDRSENNVWRGFFTLLFWDLLYGERSQGFFSEFDSVPPLIKNKKFYQEFQSEIEQRLQNLKADEIEKRLLKSFTEGYGKRTALFQWRKRLFEKIERLRSHVPQPILSRLLRDLAKDFKSHSSGYPDLTLYKDGLLEFVEVKSEGDVIRPNQLYQMRRLQDLGLKTRVINTRYSFNPNQTYVVVDVETTGGNREPHRVTEIGAVKVKGFDVVDQWSSLINPQRPIPPNITKLTGISHSMVKNAPVFSEVAEDFQSFLGDAIFVAHNVRFDYGFIQREFARQQNQFSRPNLCTVRLSRKFLKGFKSYSLKNLCRELGIDLFNHHRALDDAQAAAQILIHVNKKRLEYEDIELDEH